ncbi:type II toxin-antitoxin system RelE/ParE family toxin [Bdellovibrio bacteriovorus]|uniref:type II toxin-antitoxin system RelE/ParE family toxin n=1 Tax=Bdellovibrio TaxID=958 RepID=UPI0035A838D5
MIVNLQSIEVVQTASFKKEIAAFPLSAREDIFSLVVRFINGERLHQHDFKIFKIDKKTKILEFKVKDSTGNWRAVSTLLKGRYLVFVYAFHKKSQELLQKDKETIRNRIKRIEL